MISFHVSLKYEGLENSTVGKTVLHVVSTSREKKIKSHAVPGDGMWRHREPSIPRLEVKTLFVACSLTRILDSIMPSYIIPRPLFLHLSYIPDISVQDVSRHLDMTSVIGPIFPVAIDFLYAVHRTSNLRSRKSLTSFQYVAALSWQDWTAHGHPRIYGQMFVPCSESTNALRNTKCPSYM